MKDQSKGSPLAKRGRFLGLGLDDSDEEDMPALNSYLAEIENYLKEPKLKVSRCPFLWWREKFPLYPNMSVLARKYLSVQGTSTSAERVMSRMGIVLTKRRLSITGELFEKVMFLSDCL